MGSPKKVFRKKNQAGQITVLLGSLFLTLVLFFAFAINTGMLVNAKINLQNAADSAAYAGAAVQARQMNDLSLLNYEMRRVYKKFLARYYVLGTQASATFPTSAADTGPRVWAPRPGSLVQFGAPTVCMMDTLFGSNSCHIDNVDPIPQFRNLSVVPDVVIQTLANQMSQFEKLNKSSCLGEGQTNIMTLLLWLYNTDPSLTNVKTMMQQQSSTNSPLYKRLSLIQSFASGLGLFPKELLLKFRIEQLQKFINEPAHPRPLTAAETNVLKSQPRAWAKNERKVNAFLSAFHTLGEYSFASGGIELDELLPAGDPEKFPLNLLWASSCFTAFAQDFTVTHCDANVASDDGSNAPDPDLHSCRPCMFPFKVGDERFEDGKRCNADSPGAIPIGAAKDPKSLIYYAVRLRAKVRLLFSPVQNLEISAYAAAQPFGSRIGPPIADFQTLMLQSVSAGSTATATMPAYNRCVSTGTACVNALPNLPLSQDDQTSSPPTYGFNRKNVQFSLHEALIRRTSGETSPDSASSGGVITPPDQLFPKDINRFYAMAMAPTAWESGRYNLLSDFNRKDPMVRWFDRQGIRAIYAPIIDPSTGGADPRARIKDTIDSIFASFTNNQSLVGQGGLFSDPSGIRAFKDALTTYLNGPLTDGTGEDNEGLYIYRMMDPFRVQKLNDDGSPTGDSEYLPTLGVNGGNNFLLGATQYNKIFTSWAPPEDLLPNDNPIGRTGYSVKFIPLGLVTGSAPAPAGYADGRTSFENHIQLPEPADNAVDH